MYAALLQHPVRGGHLDAADVHLRRGIADGGDSARLRAAVRMSGPRRLRHVRDQPSGHVQRGPNGRILKRQPGRAAKPRSVVSVRMAVDAWSLVAGSGLPGAGSAWLIPSSGAGRFTQAYTFGARLPVAKLVGIACGNAHADDATVPPPGDESTPLAPHPACTGGGRADRRRPHPPSDRRTPRHQGAGPPPGAGAWRLA